MRYLTSFTFPTERDEMEFMFGCGAHKAAFPDSIYPFKIFSQKPLRKLELSGITILYGGNGSGKSTALNVIAEKLRIRRDAPFNYTPWYSDYLRMCSFDMDDRLRGEQREKVMSASRIVTSDDVFDFLLSTREVNQGVEERRRGLYQEYYETKKESFSFGSMEDYEELKRRREINSGTVSSYIRRRTPESFASRSNGESAYSYFTGLIKENAVYLLDEPENSLSAELQIKLADFISDSARFYNCQFIISTHSPFLLAMPGAKIYDLDSSPVEEKKWTELENVLVYRNFFQKHSDEFV